MIILLLAEARSGSTNLGKWLHKSLPNFKLLNEPYNVNSDVKIDVTQDYIISEKYYFNESLIKELISISDITFCLYRERIEEQIESYITALSTNNWYGVYDKIVADESLLEMQNKFLENKIKFKEFIVNNNLKSFTYEDLYYKDKINELKLFLKIESNVMFPYGEKYRKTHKQTIV